MNLAAAVRIAADDGSADGDGTNFAIRTAGDADFRLEDVTFNGKGRQCAHDVADQVARATLAIKSLTAQRIDGEALKADRGGHGVAGIDAAQVAQDAHGAHVVAGRVDVANIRSAVAATGL